MRYGNSRAICKSIQHQKIGKVKTTNRRLMAKIKVEIYLNLKNTTKWYFLNAGIFLCSCSDRTLWDFIIPIAAPHQPPCAAFPTYNSAAPVRQIASALLTAVKARPCPLPLPLHRFCILVFRCSVL